MLSGSMLSGSHAWQAGPSFDGPAEPVKPPSPEVLKQRVASLPSSNFVADYSVANGTFKMQEEQSGLRMVTNFSQGFAGRGAERYPTGETYVGDYGGARRNGHGTYTNSSGKLLSCFHQGGPKGEGVKLDASGQLVRTHNGVPDGAIDRDEADQIAKNGKLPPPPSSWGYSPVAQSKRKAPLPKPPPPPPTDYTTEAKAAYQGNDHFLQKLHAAEKADEEAAVAIRTVGLGGYSVKRA